MLAAFHVLGYLLLYFASCVNPIIYVIMNKQYRQAYAGVISCSRIRATLTPHGSSAPGQQQHNNFGHQGNDSSSALYAHQTMTKIPLATQLFALIL